MAKNSRSSITLNIKGRDWEFILVPDKTFDKLHNQDGGARPAVTMPNQYRVEFRKSDWCLVDIIHELGHVLYHMNESGTADLTADQVEETMCQLMARNYFDIGRYAGLIAEKFFGRE